MSTAFQSNAFQINAFQIEPTYYSGGYSYTQPYSRVREEAYLEAIKARRDELTQLDQRLALAEQQKLKAAMQSAQAQAYEAHAKQLAQLEAVLQEEINRLRMERVWLMRMIDDEEAILVLLLSQPFIH